MILLSTCVNKKSIENDDYFISKLINLQQKNQLEKANNLVDSLILKNNKDGAFYFQKGMIAFNFGDFKLAIIQFKIAYSFSYKKDDCARFIKTNQMLLNIWLKNDSTGRKYERYQDYLKTKRGFTLH